MSANILFDGRDLAERNEDSFHAPLTIFDWRCYLNVRVQPFAELDYVSRGCAPSTMNSGHRHLSKLPGRQFQC